MTSSCGGIAAELRQNNGRAAAEQQFNGVQHGLLRCLPPRVLRLGGATGAARCVGRVPFYAFLRLNAITSAICEGFSLGGGAHAQVHVLRHQPATPSTDIRHHPATTATTADDDDDDATFCCISRTCAQRERLTGLGRTPTDWARYGRSLCQVASDALDLI